MASGSQDGNGALAERLRRIEFLVTGQDGVEPPELLATTDQTIHARLANVEEAVKTLAARSRAVRDLLQLHSTHSTLFSSATTDDPSAFTTPEKLSIISSSATLYSTTASRLTSIQDTPIPAPELSASLIALRSRIDALEAVQRKYSEQVAELTFRTASLLQRWYELWVIGGGECWAEWEERLMGVERVVTRVEGRRERDEV